MKLFAKYHRVNLVSTIIIFLLGCLAFTLLLRYVIINQLDEDLLIEKNEISTYIKKFNHFPVVVEVDDQYVSYHKIETRQPDKIFTSEVYDSIENDNEFRRTIEFSTLVSGSWYFVSVSKSLEGADDLIQTIIIITVTLILLILAATFIINRIVLKRLWQPFYSTLNGMHQFNLSDKEKINFNATNIEEFNYLNNTLNHALSKAQNDYQSLKEFTENASHELQTPLAVIQSKLDILIQNEKLPEEESRNIQGIYNAVQTLKKLNQSLLLLAKIENKQFSEQTSIALERLLENKCSQFLDLWKNMQVIAETNVQPLLISGNLQLVEILLNNLLSNATKYSGKHGKIKIELLSKKLIVSNTGKSNAIDEKFLFKRFSKSGNLNEGYGLGLSIIKQICDTSGYNCKYNFRMPDIHSFAVEFDKQN